MSMVDARPLSLRPGTGCSRRSFLLSVLVGALAAAGCGEQDASRSTAGVPQWLPGAVGDVGAAARFGRVYLAANPGEQKLDTLLAAIEAALDGDLAAGQGDTQRVLTGLQHAVRGEYLRGESVNVEGWVLSVTEARVYAALALAQDG